jgi:membrane protein
MQIQQTIRSAALSNQAGFATVVGLVTLVIGATSVFGEIQDSINSIWKLKAKPKKGWLKILINRLISFSMVVCLGFLLMVSLLINGLMDAFIQKLTEIFPGIKVFTVYSFNMLITFLITSFLFAIIFKFLPDAKIKWKHVRAGAFTTALLFLIGKFLIGFYLGHSKLSSAYGAAGSVIVILLWVYYSAIILYFGAEFTRAYAVQTGSQIYPDDYAVWVQQIEVESKKSLSQQEEKTRINLEE